MARMISGISIIKNGEIMFLGTTVLRFGRLKETALLLSAIVLAFVCFSTQASSQEASQDGDKKYGNFHYFETFPNALFFFGDIEKNDSFEFRKALRNHDVDTVVLSSRGGSVWEGLQMAGTIFDREIITYVPDGTDCYSACAFMFFGGQPRYAVGNLGVHQFSADAKTQNTSQNVGVSEYLAQFTVSEIIGFLNEFNTPPFVFERMFQGKEIYIFSAKELEKVNTLTSDSLEMQQFEKIDKFVKIANAQNLLPGTAVEANREPQLPKREIAKLVQHELNRVGCNLGRADGVVGPASKRALKTFAKTANIAYSESLFFDGKFLADLKEVRDGYCPKIVVKQSFKTRWKGRRICINGNNFRFVSQATARLVHRSESEVVIDITLSGQTDNGTNRVRVIKSNNGGHYSLDMNGRRSEIVVSNGYRAMKFNYKNRKGAKCSMHLE